jgi:hypothetical protein
MSLYELKKFIAGSPMHQQIPKKSYGTYGEIIDQGQKRLHMFTQERELRGGGRRFLDAGQGSLP